MAKIIATGIKELCFCDCGEISTDLTGTALATLITSATKIDNVHQDTWSIEESEPSVTRYKNQLTGQPYRQTKEMGDVTMSFTIGQYDYTAKAAMMGGATINQNSGWKRSKEITNIYKCMIAKTEDGQYCVFPKAALVAREANTDKAISMSITATALEPDVKTVASEYWFDESEVTTE